MSAASETAARYRFTDHAPLIDRLRGQAFLPGVHYAEQAGEWMREAADEIERLEEVLDPELTVREMEVKVRDGKVYGSLVWGDGSNQVMKMFAALMLHWVLGEPNEEPDNYRVTECKGIEGVTEMALKVGGDFQPYRVFVEVVKPGGRSSHEIRRELEARAET